MSGIGGFCNFLRNNSTLAWREVGHEMGQTLGREGREEQGLWQNEDCLFVQRRREGSQVLTQRWNGAEYALVWDGTLFQIPQLCSQVRAAGLPLDWESPGQSLLWALIAWGEEALPRLEGEFALAFWDGGRGRLLCARDRLGRKPLCYTWQKGDFAFASRPGALFSYSGLTPSLDREGLCQILGLGSIRMPGAGVFRGIEELPGGYCLSVTPEGVYPRPYWQLSSRLHQESYPETTDRVEKLTRQAVENRLGEETQVFLSGGLASSLVTAVAAQAYTEGGRAPLRAVSLRCPPQKEEQRCVPAMTYARTVVAASHAQCLEVEWDLSALAALVERAQLARDLPGLGCSDGALLYACQAMGEGADVLSGSGAQVVFEGLPGWERWEDTLPAFPRCPDLAQRRAVFRPEVWQALEVESYVQEQLERTMESCPLLEGEPEWERRRRQSAWLALTWWLPSLMEQAEQIGEISGVRIGLPFGDARLVEYAWNIPHAMKALNGRPQQVLRDGGAGLLPNGAGLPSHPPRPKTYDGLYRQLLRSRLAALLDDPTAPIHDLVDGPALQAGWLSGCGEPMGAEMMACLLQLNAWMVHFCLRA